MNVSLPQLRSLDLSENRLADRNGISVSVFGEFSVSRSAPLPPQLKDLNLAKNNLSSQDLSALLESFCRLGSSRDYSITRLILSNNSITSLPQTLTNHSLLRELQLSYNKLTTLNGINFSLFPQLEIFDLSNNKIVTLGNVHTAISLRTLLLENNEIDSLPAELCYLTNLQTLSLHGNPQRTIRQAVLQKGVNAILATLQSKLDGQLRDESALKIQSVNNSSTRPSASLAHYSEQRQENRATDRTIFDRPNRRDIGREQPSNPSISSSRSHQAVVAYESHASTTQNPSVMAHSNTSVESDDSAKLSEFAMKIAEMEDRLQNDFSLSEASKYALKKEIAKSRANVMRLRRAGGG